MTDSCIKGAHKDGGEKPLGRSSVTFEIEDSNSSHGKIKVSEEEKPIETKTEDDVETFQESTKRKSM